MFSVDTLRPGSLEAYLIENKLLSREALHAVLAEQAITHERLGVLLTRGGFLNRKGLLQAVLATDMSQIKGEFVFTDAVPTAVLRETRTVVIAETPQKIFLGTLGSERQARIAIGPYYPGMELVFVAISYEQADNYLEMLRAAEEDESSLVERLIRRALVRGVSDIHIIPRHSTYTVFFRQHGVLQHSHEGDLEEYNTLTARIKDLARMDLAERRLPQDGAISMEFNSKLIDLRVATVPVNNLEKIVIRILDPERAHPSLDGLGITRVAEWRKAVSRTDGLCLICGPTGSGKTTTLNATLKEMDRFGTSINTLEDPVEYRIPYLAQVNINHLLGLDFARGIRAFMRADPDVIVVGEIRDEETARNAVKAAETGHLVVGTLHTRTLHGAVSRLRDLGVPPHELAYLLRGGLVQRLIRVTCKACQGTGCPACEGMGYKGREIVSECAYLPDDHDVRKLIDGTTSWPSMLSDAVLKYQQGITDEREVIRLFGEEGRAAIEALKGASA